MKKTKLKDDATSTLGPGVRSRQMLASLRVHAQSGLVHSLFAVDDGAVDDEQSEGIERTDHLKLIVVVAGRLDFPVDHRCPDHLQACFQEPGNLMR